MRNALEKYYDINSNIKIIDSSNLVYLTSSFPDLQKRLESLIKDASDELSKLESSYPIDLGLNIDAKSNFSDIDSVIEVSYFIYI